LNIISLEQKTPVVRLMTTSNYIKQNLGRVNAFIFPGNRKLFNRLLMEFGIGSLALRNPKYAPSFVCVS